METERIVIVKRRITPAVSESSRANIAGLNEKRKASGFDEETRAKLKAAQQARREREKEERAALGLDAAPVEKKKPGRPAKIKPDAPATAPRPRGRPKKQAEGNSNE